MNSKYKTRGGDVVKLIVRHVTSQIPIIMFGAQASQLDTIIVVNGFSFACAYVGV